MTTINNANDSKHLYFLYGIVAYGLFYLLWGSTLPVFMTMERLLHPTAVLIGKSIAELALFCFLFRKPKLIDIKWIPFVGIIILPTVISYLVLQAEIHLFPDIPTSAEQLVKHHVSKPVMDNLRFWTDIITWFGIMVFVWNNYRAENRGPNAREANGNILYRKEMRRQQETPCEADATNGISTKA